MLKLCIAKAIYEMNLKSWTWLVLSGAMRVRAFEPRPWEEAVTEYN